MRYQFQFPIRGLGSEKKKFSERDFAADVGISRTGLRALLAKGEGLKLRTIIEVAKKLDRDTYVIVTDDDTNIDFSTIATCYKTMRDGEESWKIHFMDLVDEFRRTLDPQLLLLGPPKRFPKHLKALLGAIVTELSNEAEINPPTWASKRLFLEEPWFVSNTQSLKATALLESPLAFRRNNVFVLENFLQRA